MEYILMSRLKDIKELSKDELAAWLSLRGVKTYRADQIAKWIYIRQADRFSEMTDLSKDLRDLMSKHFTIDRLLIQDVQTSVDGSKKFLFELSDNNRIESVLIPEKNHYTLCVSSQVGCAQGCRFCCTAGGGFTRNLTRGEIIAQVRDLIQIVDSLPDSLPRLTNLVFMGMGEPLANYDNLIGALETIVQADSGLGISSRRVTVSTVGLASRIASLGLDSSVNLAISLNAADNETRSRLMPVNRKYPLEKLIRACEAFPLKRRRRITFEYVLIKDVNDSRSDALRLAELLKPVRAKINLIPFNEFDGSRMKRPEEPDILKFQKVLTDRHYTAIIRKSKGADISAACGQLKALQGRKKFKSSDA
jgi:23S rRNA (adenine2503-C2)-methyltransferase